MNIILSGNGSSFPKHSLSNEDISKMVETSDEWIRTRTGIQSRYISANDEPLSVLAAEASEEALKSCGTKAKEIDLIIGATASPDKSFPGCACEVQGIIGAKGAFCFDVSAACSGFIYGMHIAENMMKASGYKKALVIGADALSRYVDWKDRSTCVLFGDGAGAVVLSMEEEKESEGNIIERGILATSLAADGSRGAELYRNCRGEDCFLHMNGQSIFKFALRTVPDNIEEVLKKAHICKEDIDFFVLHQANERIIDAVAKKLNLPLEKFPMNLAHTGNTSAASIPILLDELIREKKLKKGMQILISGFGAGLTWGSMVIRY